MAGTVIAEATADRKGGEAKLSHHSGPSFLCSRKDSHQTKAGIVSTVQEALRDAYAGSGQPPVQVP